MITSDSHFCIHPAQASWQAVYLKYVCPTSVAILTYKSRQT